MNQVKGCLWVRFLEWRKKKNRFWVWFFWKRGLGVHFWWPIQLWMAITPEPLGRQHPTRGKSLLKKTTLSPGSKNLSAQKTSDLWHFKWKVGVFGGISCLKNVISLKLLHRFWWNLVERWRGPNFFTFKGPAFGTPKQKKNFQFFVKILAKTPLSWAPPKILRDGGTLVFFSTKNWPHLDRLQNFLRKSRDH